MIIPVYRVVVSQYPIDATTRIEAGQVVSLDATTGKVVKCYNTLRPIGLAADRNRNAESYEWTNRVSDFGNDTRASRLMSVYHGGGEFYVDVNDSTITTPNGTAIGGVVVSGDGVTYSAPLYASGVNADAATAGMLTDTAGSATVVVATVLETEAALDSGIPGEYEPGSSVQYTTDYDTSNGTGARKWVKIKLEI